MKKLISIIITLFVLSSCNKIPDVLSKHLSTKVKSNSGFINISQFSELKWDRLYIIQPYSIDQHFDTLVYKYRSKIASTGIGSLDDRCILLLFNGNQMVNLSNVTFDIADFQKAAKSDQGKIGFYKKEDAKFTYIIDSTGFRRIQSK